jgi:hypothetical protein
MPLQAQVFACTLLCFNFQAEAGICVFNEGGWSIYALETRVRARGGGGSESSESSDEEYKCKEGSAFAPLFLIHNRSDRALVLWCFGAFFLRFLNLRTKK